MGLMRVSSTAILITLLLPLSASAVRFPDVPSSYPHAKAIDALSTRGVIAGNPDGTFRPKDSVNRAAMLKLLYTAADRSPQAAGRCFNDVQPGSWYEPFVCDAAASGFVQGYAGGAFKPDQAVTRAEALKLTIAVLGIAEADLTAPVQMYRDVKATEWYARYVHTALARGILPIPGQEGDDYMPALSLTRGEAAAYIWNASQVTPSGPPSVASSSSSSSAVSSAVSSIPVSDPSAERTAGALRVLQHEEEALVEAKKNTKPVAIPFKDIRSFNGTRPFLYTFSVTSTQTVDFAATISGDSSGGITCRLYYLPGGEAISDEYYLGLEEGKQCFLRVALRPGNWQLQLSPTVGYAKFGVEAKKVTGDGNDGFPQAKKLPIGSPRSDFLDSSDLEDWYTFTVPRDGTTFEGVGKMLHIRVISDLQLGCLAYPLSDVDLYGFEGPVCGLKRAFQPGTYMISIRHVPPRMIKQTYTVEVIEVK